MFARKIHHWFDWYLYKDGVGHYVINSISFLTTIREKYVRMYECFLEQLKTYAKVIRILTEDYLSISLSPPTRLYGIFSEVKKALQKKNNDYDLVLSCIYIMI